MRTKDKQRLLEHFLKAYFTPGAQYLPDELDDAMATTYTNAHIERVRDLTAFKSLENILTREQLDEVNRCAIGIIDDFIVGVVKSGLVKLNMED